MKRFEVGKRYYENSTTIEIIKRTAKTVTFAKIIHAGRHNEKVRDIKRAKIHEHTSTEWVATPYEVCAESELLA